MSEVALGARSRSDVSSQFYVWMAGTCLAVAVLGFMPTYFMPIAQRKLSVEPVVHIHAVVLYAWVLLFFAQTWLVSRGRVLAHRSWGMLGIAIVTAMAFIITTVVSLRIHQASLPGQPPGLAHDVRAFEWVSFGGILFFVPVFVLGILTIRRKETHKRLMLLMTIGLLGAPIARWFMVFLAPPRGTLPAPIPGLPQVEVPPVFAAIPPGLTGDLLLVIAMVFDWRTRGRPHTVYVAGGAYLLLLQLTSVPVANSAAWQSVAAAIGQLAG